VERERCRAAWKPAAVIAPEDGARDMRTELSTEKENHSSTVLAEASTALNVWEPSIVGLKNPDQRIAKSLSVERSGLI
jgi:hypothetical protein